jgi:aryl-alcohol dehydrogenase-like predicted oxidoreductase
MFGTIGNPDHEGCTGIVHKVLDGGINFTDTADVNRRRSSGTPQGTA